MTNRFEAVMAKRTHEELIKIVSVDRTDYEPLAVEAAEIEVRRRNLDTGFIEDTITRLEAEHRHKSLTDAGKGNLGTRFAHLFVDTCICHILGFALAVAAMYIVPNAGSSEAETFQLLLSAMFLLVFFLYYVGMEFAFQRTAGKFITGTKVVMANGSKPGFGAILKRTFCRLIPFDAVSFLFMKEGFHDSLSGTKVVKMDSSVISSANTPGSSFPAI